MPDIWGNDGFGRNYRRFWQNHNGRRYPDAPPVQRSCNYIWHGTPSPGQVKGDGFSNNHCQTVEKYFVPQASSGTIISAGLTIPFVVLERCRYTMVELIRWWPRSSLILISSLVTLSLILLDSRPDWLENKYTIKNHPTNKIPKKNAVIFLFFMIKRHPLFSLRFYL